MEGLNTLKLLLNKAGNYHPHYGNRLATHLPMVLSALSFLGATDEKLEATFNEGTKGLEYLNELEYSVAVEEIKPYLGDSSKYKNYLKYFNSQISKHGAKTVLKHTLPMLLPGLAASAFHGLIRLAYAIEINNDNEIAISLAYWCAEFQAFDIGDKKTSDSLESILIKLAPIGVKHTFSPGIIVDRMAEIGELLKRENYACQPNVISFTDIRKLCLRAFYAQEDFTLLHTVTGCHAFSIIMPYIENKDAALKELWKAILVAYLSTGLSYYTEKLTLSSSNCDFDTIISKALESKDSHVIKLVYSCFKEYSKHKDSLYYTVANRAVSKRGS